jgi:BASS family bile acid:Na+ symporter
LAILALTFVALGIGHLFGGPDPTDRPVLALANASRHPAIAIAIAQTTFPDVTLVPAAVLLDLIVVAFVSGPYLSWVAERSPRPVREPVRHGGGALRMGYRRRQDRER